MRKLLAFLTSFLIVAAFSVIVIAHINPQGKQTHPVGLETESCQDAVAGAVEQLADRGSINPRLLDNIEDKCGVEGCTVDATGELVCGDCSIEFDAAHKPVLVCGETEECITRVECTERGEGWSIQPVPEDLCKSGYACGIAAEFDCICPSE